MESDLFEVGLEQMEGHGDSRHLFLCTEVAKSAQLTLSGLTLRQSFEPRVRVLDQILVLI